jgi:hypothetical protein
MHILAAGFLLTTGIYLFASFWFDLWSAAWIVYVLHLALASLAFYLDEKPKKI